MGTRETNLRLTEDMLEIWDVRSGIHCIVVGIIGQCLAVYFLEGEEKVRPQGYVLYHPVTEQYRYYNTTDTTTIQSREVLVALLYPHEVLQTRAGIAQQLFPTQLQQTPMDTDEEPSLRLENTSTQLRLREHTLFSAA